MGYAGLGKGDVDHISDLAALGESIIEDQLLGERDTREVQLPDREFSVSFPRGAAAPLPLEGGQRDEASPAG